mgnify:CR=1 FL=1
MPFLAIILDRRWSFARKSGGRLKMDPFSRVDDPLKIWRGSIDFESTYIDPFIFLHTSAFSGYRLRTYKIIYLFFSDEVFCSERSWKIQKEKIFLRVCVEMVTRQSSDIVIDKVSQKDMILARSDSGQMTENTGWRQISGSILTAIQVFNNRGQNKNGSTSTRTRQVDPFFWIHFLSIRGTLESSEIEHFRVPVSLVYRHEFRGR